jgi:hypothetical protein
MRFSGRMLLAIRWKRVFGSTVIPSRSYIGGLADADLAGGVAQSRRPLWAQDGPQNFVNRDPGGASKKNSSREVQALYGAEPRILQIPFWM